MSKVLLITDQHFGVRNDNQVFIDKYREFYSNVVLPTIDRQGITEVVCLGDTFDRRKGINFASLEAAKEMWFTPLADRGVMLTMLVGNHDIYYKNTLRVNAPELLLGEYTNIRIISGLLSLVLVVSIFFFFLGFVTTIAQNQIDASKTVIVMSALAILKP